MAVPQNRRYHVSQRQAGEVREHQTCRDQPAAPGAGGAAQQGERLLVHCAEEICHVRGETAGRVEDGGLGFAGWAGSQMRRADIYDGAHPGRSMTLGTRRGKTRVTGPYAGGRG